MGIAVDTMSDEQVQAIALDRARAFRDEAPVTAAQAAKIILDGVKAGAWRILVGDDAHKLDARVRRDAGSRPTRRSFMRASPRRSAGGSGSLSSRSLAPQTRCAPSPAGGGGLGWGRQ